MYSSIQQHEMLCQGNQRRWCTVACITRDVLPKGTSRGVGIQYSMLDYNYHHEVSFRGNQPWSCWYTVACWTTVAITRFRVKETSRGVGIQYNMLDHSSTRFPI